MAQDNPDPKKDELKASLQARVTELLSRDARVSRAEIDLGHRSISYQTSAGFIGIFGTDLDARADQAEAAIFTISYIVADDSTSQRPVCFAVNGGPGAASAFLNLGALGPKRVVINNDGTMPPPPYEPIDNPDTWLEHFDLVFIDPPHTGFSTTSGEEVRKKMLSVDGDIDVLAATIRNWLTRHGRWDSPVYLAGESYGTTRAAGAANRLLDLGIALSGLILVSCAIDLQCLVFEPKNDLPYALFLPAFAGVAQYHGKLTGEAGKSGAAARAAAEDFVKTQYLAALHAGARLSDAEKSRLAETISALIGLPAALILERNLRINEETFFVELLRAEGKTVGRLEARVTGSVAGIRQASYEYDPGMDALWAPFTMANQKYFRTNLDLTGNERYDLFAPKVNEDWNFSRGKSTGNSYATTSADLAKAMRRNPHMEVFFASGYYDLGTPYSATDWSIAQLDVPATLLARVTHCYYEAGHMMYTSQADLEKMKHDIGDWLGRAG
jgi:carboxypeptidase C (cathepsin A)